MKSKPQKSTPAETSPAKLLDDISALLHKAEKMVDTAPGVSSGPPQEEFVAILKQLQNATEQLANPQGAGKLPLPVDSQNAFGVAFAAGSMPLQSLRTVAGTAVAAAFSIGLLLGVLLRRR